MELYFVTQKCSSLASFEKHGHLPLGIEVKEIKKNNITPVLKEPKTKSLAFESHCVAGGDVLLEVNGGDVRHMDRKDIKNLLKQTPGFLTLKLEYEIMEPHFTNCGTRQERQMSLFLAKENGSFGFILRRNTTPGCDKYPVISNITQRGPAEKQGHLSAGDRLLSVNEEDLAWLPLSEISKMLMKEEKAIFLFEYDINLVDIPTCDNEKLVMRIERLNAHLGLEFKYIPETQHLVIKDIQQGSLAERCGSFNTGDVILEINDIDASLLSPSKANNLLQNLLKESGKIVYMPMGNMLSFEDHSLFGDEASKKSLISKLSSDSDTCFTENSGYYNQSFDIDSLFYSNVTTPLLNNTSNIFPTILGTEEEFGFFPTVYKNVRKTNSNSSAPKTGSALEKRKLVKSNSNPLTQLKSIYSQAVHSAQKITRFLRNSPKTSKEDINTDSIAFDGQEYLSKPRNTCLVQGLKVKMMEMLELKIISEEVANTVLQRLAKVRANCNCCKEECLAAGFSAVKIIFLHSLNGREAVMNELVDDLLKTKIPCSDCDFTDNKTGVSKESCSLAWENFATSLSGLSHDHHLTDTDSEYTASDCLNENVPNIGLNVTEEQVVFKPVRYGNSREHFRSAVFTVDNTTPLESHGILRKNDELLSDKFSLESEIVHKDKPKVCENNVQVMKTTSKSKILKTDNTLLTIPKDISYNSSTSIFATTSYLSDSKYLSQATVSNPKSGSKKHSRNSNPNKLKHSEHHSSRHINVMKGPIPGSTVTHGSNVRRKADMMNVKLTDEGYGFGFVLGYTRHGTETQQQIPHITSVKLHGAARKSGVLSEGDRVLAIDGHSVVSQGLDKWKKSVSGKSHVLLTVEFDIMNRKVRYGEFEVCLYRNLKVGLIFEKVRESYPLVVQEIVQGSDAHRSGELFVGDEVLHSKYVREESFDPLTSGYQRVQTVHFYVRRRKKTDVTSRMLHSPASYGPSYTVQRTTVRPMSNSDGMLLEQEVTLFRDPDRWDFGLLVSRNPDNGRAYVTSVRPDGPADQSKIVKKHDRIVKVNGVHVSRGQSSSTLSLLLNSGDRLHLVSHRVLRRR